LKPDSFTGQAHPHDGRHTKPIGLLPIMVGTETGAQAVKRIAAPMVGSLVTKWEGTPDRPAYFLAL